jgi:hypothetical protein
MLLPPLKVVTGDSAEKWKTIKAALDDDAKTRRLSRLILVSTIPVCLFMLATLGATLVLALHRRQCTELLKKLENGLDKNKSALGLRTELAASAGSRIWRAWVSTWRISAKPNKAGMVGCPPGRCGYHRSTAAIRARLMTTMPASTSGR